MLDVRLLGEFSVLAASGAVLSSLPRRAPALLMRLALSGPGGMTRERAAMLLWCDTPAERARQSLRQLMSNLRSLGIDLHTDGDRVAMDPGAAQVDVLIFERAAASCDAASLEHAVALYRGPLATVHADPDGEFEQWRAAEQTRLHRQALTLCERLANTLAGAGAEVRLEATLQRWLALEPAAEAAHRLLMQSLLRQGRRADALDQFERCRDALHAAHGTRPDPATLAVHARLRADQVMPTQVAKLPDAALTVAVLPLATLQRDAEVLQHVADALVEDFTVALARRPALAVVASPMARAAAARAPGDLLRLGELLGVRYVVTGGLRSVAEGPARLSLNLVSAEDAMYLWGMQAELGAGEQAEDQLAAWAAEFELQACVAAARGQQADDDHAWSKVRQALRTMFERGWSEEAVQASLQVYRDAISADPLHALARAQKAILLALACNMGLRVGDGARIEARQDAEQALELAPRNSEVLGYAACALADLGEARRAEPMVQRAIAANPGNPQAWAAAGATQLMPGRTEQGIAALERGLRLSPDDYRRPVWHTLLATAHQRLGRLEQAADCARAGCQADARYHPARIALAAVEIERGNEAAARAALREALRIRPQMLPTEARGWVRKRFFARLQALWPPDETVGHRFDAGLTPP